MKLIDLTHTFTDDMPVYPGDPKSSLEQVAFIEKDTYNDHKIISVMHVGTHIDAPFHMIETGRKLDQLELEKFFGVGVLIDTRGKQKIDVSVLDDIQIPEDAVVLVYTGRDKKYRTEDYYKDCPYFTDNFAQKLVDSKVKIVGMDMLGPDLDQPWPAHKILLRNEVLILENLTNLDKLQNVNKFEVIALPTKLQSDAAPVRVIVRTR